MRPGAFFSWRFIWLSKSPQKTRVSEAYHPRVVVKFRDRLELPYDATVEKEIERRFHGAWTRLAEQFKGISMAPLFASKKADEIRDLMARAEVSDPSYHAPDFLGYFVLNVPDDAAPETVARIVSQWPSVEKAYVEPKPVEPPLVNAADDPRSMNQGYLDPAPDGIDAEYAWLFAGGDGADQALVDLEWGWTLNHEDLAAHNISIISGLNNSFFFHGTGVLGEICAVDNMVGCVGVTPKLGSVRVVGQWLSGGGYSTSQPILDAVAVMNFGDVLLLEAQTSFAGYVKVPVEIEPAVFDVIRLATALGVVVVEARRQWRRRFGYGQCERCTRLQSRQRRLQGFRRDHRRRGIVRPRRIRGSASPASAAASTAMAGERTSIRCLPTTPMPRRTFTRPRSMARRARRPS